jgi:threonine/homoserine/homoserine lactone efflux protein
MTEALLFACFWLASLWLASLWLVMCTAVVCAAVRALQERDWYRFGNAILLAMGLLFMGAATLLLGRMA